MISHLVWQCRKVHPHKLCGAKLGGFESTDDVLKSCSYNKVLLFETQLLPFKELQNKNKKEIHLSERWPTAGPTTDCLPLVAALLESGGL